MPDWATGTIKIRGTRENILKFCQEELSERANPANIKDEGARQVEWELDLADSDYDHGDLIATVHNDPSLCIWFKDSRRNFIEMDTEVPYYWDMENDGETYATTFMFYKLPKESDYCVVFPFMAAWGVDEDYYAEMSKKYKLSFRVYTVEQGMGFFSEFIAENGEVTPLSSGPNMEKEWNPLNTYGQFVWECPFPFLGG